MKKQSPKRPDNRTLYGLLILFFGVSAAGYLWEVLLYFLMNGSFANRGFFHGPWLPVYGLGAVLLACFLRLVPGRMKSRLPLLFLFSASVCTATEYVLALYLEYYRHVRYWDYTGWPLAVKGRVCLVSFLFFGLGGLLLERGLLPAIRRLLARPGRPALARILLWTVCVLFAADFVYSCAHPNTGPNISSKIR